MSIANAVSSETDDGEAEPWRKGLVALDSPTSSANVTPRMRGKRVEERGWHGDDGEGGTRSIAEKEGGSDTVGQTPAAQAAPAAPENGGVEKEPDLGSLVRTIAELQERLAVLENQPSRSRRSPPRGSRRSAARHPDPHPHAANVDGKLPLNARLLAAGIAIPSPVTTGPRPRPPSSGRRQHSSRTPSPPDPPSAPAEMIASEPPPGQKTLSRPTSFQRRNFHLKRRSVTTLSEELTAKVARTRPDAGGLSLTDYLHIEVLGTQAHGPEPEADKVHENMANFFAVPWRLEQLLVFGFFICLDTFFYVIAYLPLRCLVASALLLAYPFQRRQPRLQRQDSSGGDSEEEDANSRARRSPASKLALRFHRTHWYDLMRLCLVYLGVHCVSLLQLGRVYHFIRGQAMIKLYVLIAMVEIGDKLLSSFGQDAMDALYWQARKSPRSRRMFSAFLVAALYTMAHSTLLFIHVATLNVAINSVDAALLTLLISSNFAEIKSFVFKKFDKKNIFQLGCHDIVERFKLALFMALIGALSWCNGNYQAGPFFRLVCVVFACEMMADWVKHAFIAKFNCIDASAFGEYAVVLANDITTCRRRDMPRVINDHTYAISKRVGIAQLPLACLLIRVLMMAYPSVKRAVAARSDEVFVVIILLVYLCCVLFKVLTGMLLMATSKAITTAQAKLMLHISPRRRSMSDVERQEELRSYNEVSRFTPYKGRVV